MKIAALIMTVLLLFTVAPALSEEIQQTVAVDSDGLKLDQVVILSRHNIRSPLATKGSVLEEITPHQWFDWTSEASELSLRGAILETTMGQYFRLWLEDEGLFPTNYRPEAGAVRFYANALQRTRATAHYFSAGLLPVADVVVEQHVEYNTLDPVFIPNLNFLNEEYDKDIRREIAGLGGIVGMDGISAGLRDAMEKLMDVVDMEDSAAYQSGKYGNFLEDDTQLLMEDGEELNLAGPIKIANTLIDSMTLQYYEESDEMKAAFGHKLTLEDWQYLHSIAETYNDMLFRMPLVSVNVAHPMLQELYTEINTEGRKFTFLCGHDSTIASTLGALGVEDYLLPEAIEQRTPIGGKVVIERWLDGSDKVWYNVSLVYQSVDQLRNITPLSLDTPPKKYQLHFKGVNTNDDGMIAEADFMNLIKCAIDAYNTLMERYGVDNAEEVMPAA